MAVGSPCMTSRAKLGPENTHKRGGNLSSTTLRMTSLMRMMRSVSMPLVALTKIMSGRRFGSICRRRARGETCEGITVTTISASASASGEVAGGPTVFVDLEARRESVLEAALRARPPLVAGPRGNVAAQSSERRRQGRAPIPRSDCRNTFHE